MIYFCQKTVFFGDNRSYDANLLVGNSHYLFISQMCREIKWKTREGFTHFVLQRLLWYRLCPFSNSFMAFSNMKLSKLTFRFFFGEVCWKQSAEKAEKVSEKITCNCFLKFFSGKISKINLNSIQTICRYFILKILFYFL